MRGLSDKLDSRTYLYDRDVTSVERELSTIVSYQQ